MTNFIEVTGRNESYSVRKDNIVCVKKEHDWDDADIHIYNLIVVLENQVSLSMLFESQEELDREYLKINNILNEQ